MKTQITFEDYEEAVSADLGWCAHCGKFTAEGIEPDARRYPCEVCGHDSVYGVEEAMMLEMFELAGEP